MAPVFPHSAAQPFSPVAIIALIFLVLASALVSVTIWLFLIRGRQRRLPASATQVHVQVEVEKSHEATSGIPPSRSSILPLPMVAPRPPSTPNPWLQTLMHKLQRSHSDAAIGSSPPSPSVDDRYTRLPPSPRDSRPPARREMWLAFETNASLATFDHDPLEDDGSPRDRSLLLAFLDDSDSSSTVSTPALVSGTASPASTWEPQTPPSLSPIISAGCPPIQAVTLPDSARSVSAIGPFCEPSVVTVKVPTQEDLKIPETVLVDLRPTRADGFPSPSNFAGRFDTPPTDMPDSSFSSDMGTDCEGKADGDTRYAALLNAFSASFSSSSLGLSGSECGSDSQVDSIHFHAHSSELGVVSFIPFGDTSCSDERRVYDGDCERDIGTVALRRSCSLAEYSFLAI